ncbi:MAG: hypothetical protein JNK15_06210 [Planctomycetes bacterium]|nr:hypothetical protein [Planctomycetota bacterium]
MSSTVNLQLSSDLAEFVRARVESGAFPSADAVVGEALRCFAARWALGGDGEPALLEGQEQEIDREQASVALERLLQLRNGTTLGPGLTVRDLRRDGQR